MNGWLNTDQVEQPGNGWKVEFGYQEAIYWSAARARGVPIARRG